MVGQLESELTGIASGAGPMPERARDMLLTLRRLVPFDAAWIAGLDRSRYVSLASVNLDPSVLDYLRGPTMAREIELTGASRRRPPLTLADLPYPAEELRTWAECLLPVGFRQGLSVALFEPGGRHVGFVTLLAADPTPPPPSSRARLGRVTELLAHGIDPTAPLAAASRLVGDAFAGVLLLDHGRTDPLSGLAAHELLAPDSRLIETVRARSVADEVHLSFLWPHAPGAEEQGHVRVTYLTANGAPHPGLQGLVLLSPPGPLHGLTPRELEVLGMMVEGCSNQQIARQLVVTARTVATHVEHILAKLGSPTRTHAAVHAQREGLYVPVAAY